MLGDKTAKFACHFKAGLDDAPSTYLRWYLA